MAQIDPEKVDMVLLCTSTPDDIFGSATSVQAGLGCSQAVGMDLTAACSGFVLGLVTAGAYLRSGMAKTVVLIGADCLSRYVDWTDRGTCILFGDGAGDVVEGAPRPNLARSLSVSTPVGPAAARASGVPHAGQSVPRLVNHLGCFLCLCDSLSARLPCCRSGGAGGSRARERRAAGVRDAQQRSGDGQAKLLERNGRE